MKEQRTALQQIGAALIACGYTSLDAQAQALGVPRSTAWTIVKSKHKLGRISVRVMIQMLSNPELPPQVREAVENYAATRETVSKENGRRRSAIRGTAPLSRLSA
jgi:hypothetical protein